MGIYYQAMERSKKQKFEAPGDFSIKLPGIFHPTNPFSGMVVMMNSFGNHFDIVNDCLDEYYDDDYVDITDEVYAKYLNFFPWAKDEIYEPKEDKQEGFK